jgi:hypothetical protein
VRARIHGDCVARIVDIHGTVVAQARDVIAVPLEAIETDVFLLDLDGLNRYVMTRTENLAPLLDLPRARIEPRRDGALLELRNTGEVAAIGVVVEGGLSDNVLDLLPGESRTIEAEGDAAFDGWNV